MSQKEQNRRRTLSKIFKLAWNLYNKSGRWQYSFSTCLKKAYRLMKSLSKRIYSKVRGTSFTNDDGISCQVLLQRLTRYKPSSICLELLPEPSNPYDSNVLALNIEDCDLKKKSQLIKLMLV